jgi:hypothetical protein
MGDDDRSLPRAECTDYCGAAGAANMGVMLQGLALTAKDPQIRRLVRVEDISDKGVLHLSFCENNAGDKQCGYGVLRDRRACGPTAGEGLSGG